MKALFVLALALCCVAGESIMSLEVNYAQGLVYALSDTNKLYELSNLAVQKTHSINYRSPTAYSSSFLQTVNGTTSLLQTMSSLDIYYSNIIKLDLPFGNKATLTPSLVSSDGYGYTDVPTIFSLNDQVALMVSNDNLINLFDLNTLNQTAELHIFMGTRHAATAVAYDYKTNHVAVFWSTFTLPNRKYLLYVSEFKVQGDDLIEIDSSFEALSDSHSYPFHNTEIYYAAFDDANNVYWGLDIDTPRLTLFKATNLSYVEFIDLPANTNFDNGNPVVVYNFPAQLAYVFSYISNGFRLQEVDLSAGTIRRSNNYNTGGYPAGTAELDLVAGNLYVGLMNTPNATLCVIALANLSQVTITL